MGRFMTLFTAVSLFVLSLGAHYAPDYPAFWLVSGSSIYIAARVALGLVIMGQLVTRPPRKIWFRVLAGVLAVVVGAWTVRESYNYHMMATDTLLFMLASISIALTALEAQSLSFRRGTLTAQAAAA